MTNLYSIFKSRDIILLTKVRLVKATVFPVVMYGCESWTIKETERWRIEAFELWCWRRLLRVPWTARSSNQFILMAEIEEELKSVLMKAKEESEKAGWKLSIQKTKMMASGLINSWQIDGEAMETVTDVIFLGSKITADSDCSNEIKHMLAPWKESFDKLRQHIQKQRHYFADKSPSSQSYSFSSSHVWIWELDN